MTQTPRSTVDPDAAARWVGAKLPAIVASLGSEGALRPDDCLGLCVVAHAGLVGYASGSYLVPMPTRVDAVCQISLRGFGEGNERLFEAAKCVRSEGSPTIEAYRAAISEWFHGWFEDVYLPGLAAWFAMASARAAMLATPPGADEEAKTEVSRPLSVACALVRAIGASKIYSVSTSAWELAIAEGLGPGLANRSRVTQTKLDVVSAFSVPGSPSLGFPGVDGRIHLNWRAVKDHLVHDVRRPRPTDETGKRYFENLPDSLDAPISAAEDSPALSETLPAPSDHDVLERIALRDALDVLAAKYAGDPARLQALEYVLKGSTDVASYADRAGCAKSLVSMRAKEIRDELRRMLNPGSE